MIELSMAIVLGCGVVGLSLIITGYATQQKPVVVHVHPPPLGRIAGRGRVDRTGRLAEVNGMKIVLGEAERPRAPVWIMVGV